MATSDQTLRATGRISEICNQSVGLSSGGYRLSHSRARGSGPIGPHNQLITGADLIAGGEQGLIAFTPARHHALVIGWWFCFLNNAAIAANVTRNNGLHRGSGRGWYTTAMAHRGIFYDRNGVLTVSIHADPGFYPFFWGYGQSTAKAHQPATGAGTGDEVFLNRDTALTQV
jgi:hypothetical protein